MPMVVRCYHSAMITLGLVDELAHLVAQLHVGRVFAEAAVPGGEDVTDKMPSVLDLWHYDTIMTALRQHYDGITTAL